MLDARPAQLSTEGIEVMAALKDIKASAHKIPSKAGNRAHEDMPS